MDPLSRKLRVCGWRAVRGFLGERGREGSGRAFSATAVPLFSGAGKIRRCARGAVCGCRDRRVLLAGTSLDPGGVVL